MNPFSARKKTIRQFSVACTNIRSLCPDGKKADLKLHTIFKADADIHIIVDSRLNENGVKKWKKSCKTLLSKIQVNGNFSKDRGVTIFSKKSIGVSISMIEKSKKRTLFYFI
jgi:hypothetical protein